MDTDQRNPNNLVTVCRCIGKARRIRVSVQRIN